MYTGYLRLGETEIANTDRLHGYLSTADCVLAEFHQTPCGTVQDALNHSPYEASNISEAPWYDPVNSEVSSRFYGVAAYDITGIHDSTRSIPVTQAVRDGGILGDPRHETKEVKVKAILYAKGQDALDYGLNWLAAALEPGACGQHGGSCGFTDLSFWTTCPPPVPELWAPEDGGVDAINQFTNPRFTSTATKVEVRRNLHPNPSPWTSGVDTGYTSNATEATFERVGRALRWTSARAGDFGVRFTSSSMSTVTGNVYRIMLRARASRPLEVKARVRGGTEAEPRTLGTEWTWIDADVIAG